MSVFTGASNFVVNDGHFIAMQAPKDWEKEKDALRQLEQHVAFGAFHNSKERRDPPKCHPRTRQAVFREIVEWIQTISADKPILWLYGPAGAGKSAIAQSIAEKVCRREILGCLLVATFFFNRSNSERNNADRIIPSLAYQMTTTIPSTREFVVKAIIQDPHVFSLNLRTQLEKLIIEPLLSSGIEHSSDGFHPMLIIVDGLDECQEFEERTEIIEAFAESVQNPALHLMILCHSRPESDIRTAFNDLQTSKLTARLILDDRFEPDADIQLLLHHDFSEIKRIHPLKNRLPRDWPPEEAIEALVRKSSGQFVYVSTVMKYIASKRHNPTKRLEVVLNVGSGTDASPFKELDALYMLALSSVDENDRPTLVRIIGMICFPGLYGQVLVTPELIDDVLNLEPGGTLLILNDLHSLIDVHDPEDIDLATDLDDSDSEGVSSDYFEIGLRPFHASFSDFLQDRSRSYEYYVDRAVAIADRALAWFKALLDRIVYPPTKFILYPMFRGHFGGNLTKELFEFFASVPWESLVKIVLPNKFPRRRRRPWFYSMSDSWALGVYELYRFCNMASKISPTWATISDKAFKEVTRLTMYYLDSISSSADSATTNAIQDELRYCYIAQLLGEENFVIGDPGAFIIDILRTSGLPIWEPIDRKKYNLAIFDTILEGLVTTRLMDHISTLDDGRLQNRAICASCLRTFTCLFGLADHTSYIDALLSYIEDKDSPYRILRSQEGVQRAITAYKEKPIPDDYDYDFRLEPSIEVLRERFEEARVAREAHSDEDAMEIGLSDLGLCNFIRFQKFQTW